MKYEISGRVIGHAIFCPNPKDEPELELVRVALTLSPATSAADKHTKAILIVEKDSIWRDFVIGRYVRLTIEDSQQDLFLPPATDRKDAPTATVSTVDPETGELLKTDLHDDKGMARVVGAIVGGAAARGRRRRTPKQVN